MEAKPIFKFSVLVSSWFVLMVAKLKHASLLASWSCDMKKAFWGAIGQNCLLEILLWSLYYIAPPRYPFTLKMPTLLAAPFPMPQCGDRLLLCCACGLHLISQGGSLG